MVIVGDGDQVDFLSVLLFRCGVLLLNVASSLLQVAGLRRSDRPTTPSLSFSPQKVRRIQNAEPNLVFLQAIARDGRSFHPEVFRQVSGILAAAYSSRLDMAEALEDFARLVDRFEAIAAEDALDDEELGEIPDEYLDPILATLMTDPVRLPASGQVIDRSTIRAHLLSNPRDPFNRAPLKIDEVVPDDKLRSEIERWVAEKKSARMQ
eukprot:m.1132008 g.1132008  ORF g.1132008 m.1132008 type:complete len:208 (+) comp24425_c0_seq15:2913-3536(+)